jgi:hypothetical protein
MAISDVRTDQCINILARSDCGLVISNTPDQDNKKRERCFSLAVTLK